MKAMTEAEYIAAGNLARLRSAYENLRHAVLLNAADRKELDNAAAVIQKHITRHEALVDKMTRGNG